MVANLGSLSLFFYISQIGQPNANTQGHDNVTSMGMCVGNKNIEVQVSDGDLTCQASEISKQKVRDDYIHTPGAGYHKLHIEGKNWNDARKICMSEGGHLAIINSPAEEKILLDLIEKNKKNIKNSSRPDSVWLGVHNLFANSDWVTVHGNTLASTGYVNWSKGCNGHPPEPNNHGGNEHCVGLYSICKGWNDFVCSASLAFVCEIPDVCAQ